MNRPRAEVLLRGIQGEEPWGQLGVGSNVRQQQGSAWNSEAGRMSAKGSALSDEESDLRLQVSNRITKRGKILSFLIPQSWTYYIQKQVLTYHRNLICEFVLFSSKDIFNSI